MPSMLTAAHEPLIRAQALNHVSPWFADVVWRGLSTRTCDRASTATSIWIASGTFGGRSVRGHTLNAPAVNAKTLLVYARYDLTFPVDLSETPDRRVRDAAGSTHEVAVLPCGHYSTGYAPFKFLDGYILTQFLRRNL